MSDLTIESLRIEWWPIERPIPYARNARQVPEAAIDKVKASIKEFGWRQPIVVDDEDVILAGHTRLLAAQRLALEAVPVHVAENLSPAQAKAYRLMDNRSAQETSWDEELLALEFNELSGLEIDLALTGFDETELQHLLAEPPTDGFTDPDSAPEPPIAAASRLGDLWLLGGHRLLCGDATNSDDVQRLMDGKRALLMATDPPYLVDYQGGAHPATEGNKGLRNGKPTGASYEKEWDQYVDHEHSVDFYRDFLVAAVECALDPHAAVYQCFAIMRSNVLWEAWEAAGLLMHQVLIWHKTRAVLTYSAYLWNYEPFAYGWLRGNKPPDDRRPPHDAKAVWEIESKIEDGAGSIHPTMKPVELIRRPIEYHTRAGELIYEPFSGSGTAIIAAESAGRCCNALELSPAFVDVAVQRWQAFTGEQATLAGDGRSFDEVAAERSS
jgi:DNA modification methylase